MATPVGQRTRSRRHRSLPPAEYDSLDGSTSFLFYKQNPEDVSLNRTSVSFSVSKENRELDNGLNTQHAGATPRNVTNVLDKLKIQNSKRSPLTPVQNVVHHMRQRLEHKLLLNHSIAQNESHSQSYSNPSPGLEKLRNTPGPALEERQQDLERKHHEAKSRGDSLNIGGGVSIWPEMNNMRLTREEIRNLVILCVLLLPSTVMLFNIVHGSVLMSLHKHTSILRSFPILVYTGESQGSWDSDVLHWHTAFTQQMYEIEERFSVSLGRSTITYQASVIIYIVGMATLLYLLTDNIVSKSKLSPKRIKIWVCLLVVLGTWTVLVCYLLIAALSLEDAIQQVVITYSGHLSDLVYTNLTLTTYSQVLSVWQTRCLPPTGDGTLSVLGLIRVRNVVFCLQYYSLPILTALLTPVVQLVLALKDIYATHEHSS